MLFEKLPVKYQLKVLQLQPSQTTAYDLICQNALKRTANNEELSIQLVQTWLDQLPQLETSQVSNNQEIMLPARQHMVPNIYTGETPPPPPEDHFVQPISYPLPPPKPVPSIWLGALAENSIRVKVFYEELTKQEREENSIMYETIFYAKMGLRGHIIQNILRLLYVFTYCGEQKIYKSNWETSKKSYTLKELIGALASGNKFINSTKDVQVVFIKFIKDNDLKIAEILSVIYLYKLLGNKHEVYRTFLKFFDNISTASTDTIFTQEDKLKNSDTKISTKPTRPMKKPHERLAHLLNNVLLPSLFELQANCLNNICTLGYQTYRFIHSKDQEPKNGMMDFAETHHIIHKEIRPYLEKIKEAMKPKAAKVDPKKLSSEK